MADWYLVHTKSKKESSVQGQLSEWLPEVLLPMLKVHVRRWAKLVPSIAPLFPCYVFVFVDLSYGYARLKYTNGVRDIVCGGYEPLVVPESIMHQVKLHCQQWPVVLPLRRLVKGEPVVIAEGGLQGFEAVFERYLSGSQRVALLLSSVSSAVRVVVPASSVESAGEMTNRRPSRLS
jgi:transcription antitermination factor NusG